MDINLIYTESGGIQMTEHEKMLAGYLIFYPFLTARRVLLRIWNIQRRLLSKIIVGLQQVLLFAVV